MGNDTFRVSFQQAPPRPSLGFSQTELTQLLLSWGVLTLAFAVMFDSGVRAGDLSGLPYSLALAAVAVFTAFVCHEVSHKLVAQRYGCWAEFRYWPMGLLMALLFSFMGFLFAAPGAVMIRGRLTERQNGVISAVGPGSNMALAAAMVPLLFLTGSQLVFDFAYTVGLVNAFIGGFNLIPLMPFDGSKIVRWNLGVYIALVAGALVLIAFYYGLFF